MSATDSIKTRVFISWSGGHAKSTAEKLRDFLKALFTDVEVFLSSRDIDGGVVWWDKLTDALRNYAFGILILNEENKESPWVLFEAGVLFKGLSETRVLPLLYNVTPGDLLESPLSKFQSQMLNRDGLYEVMRAINGMLPDARGEEALREAFDVWWDRRGQPVVDAANADAKEKEQKEPKVTTRDLMARLDRLERVIRKEARENRESVRRLKNAGPQPPPVRTLKPSPELLEWVRKQQEQKARHAEILLQEEEEDDLIEDEDSNS